MLTPYDIANSLLPDGSRGDGGLDHFLIWPPDMFAVTAEILNRSGVYTSLKQLGSDKVSIEKQKKLNEDVNKIADAWSTVAGLSKNADFWPIMQGLWSKVICRDSIDDLVSDQVWIKNCLVLFAIADQSCEGMGFLGSERWVPVVYDGINIGALDREDVIKILGSVNSSLELAGAILGDIPSISSKNENFFDNPSACLLVSDDVVCVQPKTRTPKLGCSIRNLSHHAALLPAKYTVQTNWHSFPKDVLNDVHKLNILFFPYPYNIGVDAFGYSTERKDNFSIEQHWLSNFDDFLNVVEELMRNTLRKEDRVDVLLLPELALNKDCYTRLIRRLEKKNLSPNMLISGVGEASGDKFQNKAIMTIFDEDKSIEMYVEQDKHHQWRLDAEQVKTYRLHGLSETSNSTDWLEHSSIDDRSINMFVYRNGACLATLICEDIARVDPCLRVIREVGPNILFALLMDGPQMKERWSAACAKNLSDDPGTSVLSVTSLGLIERSKFRFPDTKNIVALWHDPANNHIPIELMPGHKAIFLQLDGIKREEFTMDERSDTGSAQMWLYNKHYSMELEKSKQDTTSIPKRKMTPSKRVPERLKTPVKRFVREKSWH